MAFNKHHTHTMPGNGIYQESGTSVPDAWTKGDLARLVQIAALQTNQPYKGATPNMTGSKPIVVCAGSVVEVKDLEDAQAVAERLAHQHQADAYVLKPVRKVAPKRDVVTTDL